MKNKDWVIIITTPFKNEENDIKNTIEHMINQKIKPTYWIMVDDYSDDNSYKIASQFTEKNPWIKVIKSPFKKNKEYTLGFHIAKIKSYGLKYGIELCKKNKKKIDFLGIVDGDVFIPTDFIEKSIDFFLRHDDVGIVSSYFKGADGKDFQYKANTISGGGLVISYKCYQEIGGLVESTAFDSATRAKAIIKGWNITRVPELYASTSREVASGDGVIKGYHNQGNAAWYLGLPFYIAILKSIYYSIKKHPKIGISYIRGYLLGKKNLKNNINKIAPDIYQYYHYNRAKEILMEILKKN